EEEADVVTSVDAGEDEEVVGHRDQTDRPADTRLLVQGVQQSPEVAGQRDRKQVDIPVVFFAVGDGGEVARAVVVQFEFRHRRSTRLALIGPESQIVPCLVTETAAFVRTPLFSRGYRSVVEVRAHVSY